MKSARGFCDLNVCVNNGNKAALRNTCQSLYELGFRTVALNTICDASIFESKKKKKGDTQEKQTDIIPEPAFSDIIEQFEGKLIIIQRLTVEIQDQLQAHKLGQSTNAKKYNILAIVPANQTALAHACSNMDVELISFDPDNIGAWKCGRRTYNLAISRNIWFELMYTPAIRDSTMRKSLIQMAHIYHAFGKSRNIIITSGAANPYHVRGPYDIINFGLLFGLSEEQAKAAITTNCRQLLLKAAGRHIGKTVVLANKINCAPSENNKLTDGSDSEKMDVEESEQPVQKRLKQE